MGLVKKTEVPAVVESVAIAPARVADESTTVAKSDALQIITALLGSPLIANLALTVPEDKRGELLEKYYSWAVRLIQK